MWAQVWFILFLCSLVGLVVVTILYLTHPSCATSRQTMDWEVRESNLLSIRDLARTQAKKIIKYTENPNVCTSIRIAKKNDQWNAICYQWDQPSNGHFEKLEQFTQNLTDFLNENVLPYLPGSLDLKGYYGVQPGDFSDNDDHLLAYGNQGYNKAVLIPDQYAMSGALDQRISQVKKLNQVVTMDKDRILFVGSINNGPHRGSWNQWYQETQGSEQIADIRCLEGITTDAPGYMDLPSQMEYMFQLSIDGHNCCWDRIPQIMSSNSVCFKSDSVCNMWYYPALQPFMHYLPVQPDSIEYMRDYALSHPAYMRSIVQNAQKAVDKYMTKEAAIEFHKHFWTYVGGGERG